MSGLFGTGNAPTNSPPIYSGLNVSTSQWNLPVPIFWGTRRLSTNAIDYANFQKHAVSAKGGKGGGGKGGQQYDYTADVLLALCEGPIDAIQNIWASGSTTTTTTLSALKMTLFTGTATQAVWSYWETNYPAKALPYRLTAYLGAIDMDLGESATIPDNNFECVRTSMFGWTRSGTVAGWINPTSHTQSNAIDVLLSDCINDLLTTPQYGQFMASADIGDMTLFATYLRAQGIFASPLLNSQEKVTDIFNRWAQISNSWIFWGGTQLQFVPLGDAAVTGNGVTYTPQNDVDFVLTLDDLVTSTGSSAGRGGNTEPPVKVSRKDPADCYNRTSVNINDRTLGYISNPIEYKDQTLVDLYGLRDNTSVSADEICDPAVGRIIAELIGKRAAYIRNAYTFKLFATSVGILCLPGTVLTIPLNFTGQSIRVRVTGVAEDDKGTLTIDAEEFPGTVGTYVPPLATAAASTTSFPNLYAAPSSVNTPAIVEAPAAYTGGTAKLLVAASGQTNWGGCDVWISFDGENYPTKIGTITTPAAQGVLTAGLASFTTGTNPDTTSTLSVDCTQSGTVPQQVSHADAEALRTLSLVAPQPTTSGSALVVPTTGELLAFGAVNATGTYTADLTWLERGQYGTADGAHAAGAQFTLIDPTGTTGTSVAFDLPAGYIGSPIYLKFASFNAFGNATQDLADCQEYIYTPTGAGYGTAAGGLPSVPTSMTATPGPAEAGLAWAANPSADNVTAYRLYRAPGAGAAFSAATLIWTGFALNYTDSSTAATTAYTWFVEAVNDVGASAESTGADTTTLATGAVTASQFIFNETPTGTVDGTNTVFTLAHTPIAGALTFTINGAVQAPGTAYTLSGATITCATAPASGAVLLATYLT